MFIVNLNDETFKQSYVMGFRNRQCFDCKIHILQTKI